jgi:hypothetical protein
MKDKYGIIEFPDDVEPTPWAMRAGLVSYQLTGFNSKTGNRTAEITISPKCMKEILAARDRGEFGAENTHH